MTDQDDIDYFRGRARAERELADSADDSAAALIHAKLAERYERIVARENAPRPILHIVTSRPSA